MKTIKKIIKRITILGLLLYAKSAYALDNPAPGLFPNLGLGERPTFAGIITFIITNIVIPIVGLITIIFIIIGGFQYITARGDEEQAATGKKTLSNAIIGLVIVILSYIIVVVVINAIKGNVGR